MNKRPLFGICASLVGLALFVVGIRLLLKPAEYQATVKIEINEDIGYVKPGSEGSVYDPYFIETELSTIRGDVVLSNVVQALNLNIGWGKRYAGGKELSTDETIKLLRYRMRIDLLPNTRLAEIQVRDESPDEAARLANTIAEAYRNYRIDLHRREMDLGIKKLEETYEEQATNIVNMETNLEHIAMESNLTNSDLPDAILQSRFPNYYGSKMELEKQEDLHKHLKSVIDEDKTIAVFPRSALVTVVNPAVPPKTPVGPNRWLGGAFLICGLAALIIGSSSSRKVLS